MNKQTKYTLLPKLSLESVYTDPINWIVVRGKDQDHSWVSSRVGAYGAPRPTWVAVPAGFAPPVDLSEPLLGRWAQTGDPGTGSLTSRPGCKLCLVWGQVGACPVPVSWASY